jgi:hypothetical protein
MRAKQYVYCVVGTVAGMFIFDSFSSLGRFVISVLIMVFVFAGVANLIGELMHHDSEREYFTNCRGSCYTIAVFVLFGLTWVFASLVSAPVEPGDEIGERRVATISVPRKPCDSQRSIHLQLFAVLLTPTLLGARTAIGPKRVSKTTRPT